MSTESLNPESSSWRIEEEECEGLAVKARIVPDDEMHATELIHAAQVRKLTMNILNLLGFNQTERLRDIALVLSEFTANCILNTEVKSMRLI